jgi:glutaredoxin
MRSFLFLALSCATFAAGAQIYRWTDDKGRVHLTGTPPPAGAKDVQQRSGSGAPLAGASGLPYTVQRTIKENPVTLYTAPGCAPCGEARDMLNARGVPFSEVLVVDDKQKDELKKAVGSLSVPSIRVGTRVQKGFEAGAYQAMLDSAGYPRTGILPARHQAEPAAAASPAAQPPAESAEEKSREAPGPYAPR